MDWLSVVIVVVAATAGGIRGKVRKGEGVREGLVRVLREDWRAFLVYGIGFAILVALVDVARD